MSDIFLTVTWSVDPQIIGPVRYYGLFFALSFLLGYVLVKHMAKNDGLSQKAFDRWLIYVMVGTVIGARLGHVLFYGFFDYMANPSDILKVWEGGLASHGAAIGIIVASWLLSRKEPKLQLLFSLDRAVVTIALACFFIRMGNLFNSEIIGEVTTVPWGFWFTRVDDTEVIRHPSQLYEALCYLFIFGLLAFMYYKKGAGKKRGLLLGTFMVLVFTARFFVEFTKQNQAEFIAEEEFLNMGQYLSIPLIIVGIVLIVRALKKGNAPETAPAVE